MVQLLRRTLALRQVLLALTARPDAPHFGYDLSRDAGLRSGSMYPILQRLLEAGWLTDAWEDAESARAMGRPPRRYYRLTEHGASEARRLLETT